MKKAFLPIAVFSVVFLCVTVVSAQPASPERNTQGPVKLFYSSINENAHLYNGTEYIMYDQHIKGDPYFIVADMREGMVLYDGTLYENVPMLYELTTGNVVVRAYNNGVLMNLINEKVGYFTLLNHTFVHIMPDSANTTITDGFYDRLYNGNAAVYVKRQKIAFEDPSTFERSFIVKDRYFIYKNATWYAVSGESDVLRIFKEKKKDITKYLRQNKIKFKKDPEYAMVKMAEYYDQLTH